MLSPSKKLYYAVEAVLYIAYNGGNTPISGRDIAVKQGMPSRHLEQLMQKLVRAGILRGLRGPHGGYVLAKERRRISVGDICMALRDEDDKQNYGGTTLGKHIAIPIWDAAQGRAMDYLYEISLAELCEQALAKNIRKETQQRMDFAI